MTEATDFKFESGVAQVLTRDNTGLAQSWIIVDAKDYHIDVKVFMQYSHALTEPETEEFDPTADDLVFDGYIKWDGCSHISFGDQLKYAHLCGFWTWAAVINALTAAWNFVQKVVASTPELATKFDNSEFPKYLNHVIASD